MSTKTSTISTPNNSKKQLSQPLVSVSLSSPASSRKNNNSNVINRNRSTSSSKSNPIKNKSKETENRHNDDDDDDEDETSLRVKSRAENRTFAALFLNGGRSNKNNNNSASASRRNKLARCFAKFCGNWDDGHARRWKRLHLLICVLLIIGGISYSPFEYSRSLLVLDEIEGRTGIAVAAPELEYALDPAGTALLLLDEISQGLNLTVWDFKITYDRFGLTAQQEASPLSFLSDSEIAPFMFLSNVGERYMNAAETQSTGVSPLILSSSVFYQLTTDPTTTSTSTTTVAVSSATNATDMTTVATSATAFVMTNVSSNETPSSTFPPSTVTTTTTPTSTTATTIVTTVTDGPNNFVLTGPPAQVVGGFGEAGCELPASSFSSTSSWSPRCYHVTENHERHIYNLGLTSVLNVIPNWDYETAVKSTAKLSSYDVLWSEKAFPSWQLSNGEHTIWGELEEEGTNNNNNNNFGSSTTPTAMTTMSNDNATSSTSTTTPSTIPSTMTILTTLPNSNNETASSNLRLRLFAPLFITPARDPLLYASVFVDVRQLQLAFRKEFANPTTVQQLRAQQSGVIGLWLDRRGPTTAGRLVAWSGSLVDHVYNATDTPWAEVNGIVLRLLTLNGGLLPQHSVTLFSNDFVLKRSVTATPNSTRFAPSSKAAVTTTTAFVCRIIEPHWIAVTFLPPLAFESSPLFQPGSANQVAQSKVYAQTLNAIPLSFMFCAFTIILTFHGLIMSFKKPPKSAKQIAEEAFLMGELIAQNNEDQSNNNKNQKNAVKDGKQKSGNKDATKTGKRSGSTGKSLKISATTSKKQNDPSNLL